MSRDLRATAILDARDNTGGAFTSAARKLAALEGRMKTFNAGQRTLERNAVATADRRAGMLDKARGVLVGGATALTGYGITAYAAGAVKRYSEVERAMTRTGITGEATDEQIAAGIEKMRKLAMETAQPFDKMREGMDALTSSGKSFQESLAMMPAIARTAQASGAGMADTANSSVALLNHLSIKAEELQAAQDIMAKAGKLGQFEAKDMARYFPSMMPAASSVGFKGLEGLKQLSAVVQTIRSGTGTSEEASGSAMNIFAKMESEETAKKFKKFGVDLRAEMETARKRGANLFDTFLDLAEKALKGDMSKLPQLFQDMEVQRGMRPLLKDRAKIAEYKAGLNDADGTIAGDLQRVLKNKQTDIDRFAAAWDQFTTAVGKRLAGSASGNIAIQLMETAAKNLENPLSQAEKDKVFADVRATLALRDSLRGQGEIEAEMRRLLERGKDGKPIPVTRLRNLDILRREASQKATDAANRLIPKPEGPDGFYDVLPFGARDVQNARDEGYGFRPSFGKLLNRAKPGDAVVDAPAPPTRPKSAEPFPVTLDFDGAVDSAKQGKFDIEAALREIDLAASGQQAGAGFRTGLVNELKQAETEATGIVGRLKSMLSFTATPKVNVGLPQGTSRAGGE